MRGKVGVERASAPRFTHPPLGLVHLKPAALRQLQQLDSAYSRVEQCLKYMPTQILSDHSSSHHHLKSDKF